VTQCASCYAESFSDVTVTQIFACHSFIWEAAAAKNVLTAACRQLPVSTDATAETVQPTTPIVLAILNTLVMTFTLSSMTLNH
jgi:hypothetical protein